MGYVSKDIAIITEPAALTLSAVPNFVQFASKPADKTYLEVNIAVNDASGKDILNWDNTYGFYNLAIPDYSQAFVASDNWRCQSINCQPGDRFAVWSYIPPAGSAGLALVHFYGGGVLKGYLERGGQSQTPEASNYRFTVPSDVDTLVIHCYSIYATNARIIGYNESTELDVTLLRITDPSGSVRSYRGTNRIEEVGGPVFYVSADTSDTAENLRQVLLSDRWFSANYEVVIPFIWEGENPKNGNTLNIKSKGAGIDFNITIDAPNDPDNIAYTIDWINQKSVNNDSISGESPAAEINLDIYTDPGIFLGQDDRPINLDCLGTYVTTLQKTYAGVPVWFDLNALFAQYGGFNYPPGVSGWFDTGTSRTYRFFAKIKGANSSYFYASNALYVLNGYGPASEDLTPYIYRDNTIRLLTNKPRTPYIRGQREYLNFIFADPQRGAGKPVDFTLRIAYRAYSTSEDYLGTVYGQEKAGAGFAVVNTCVLDIDAVLDMYPTAGIVRVALACGTAIVSNDLEYVIRPECLHTLRQFSFINRLGGWDAFNFDADAKDEIKPTVETYNKTLTPSYGITTEMVYNTTLANTFTVEGAPVTDEVAAWLKELASARVILDGKGNYIIIEDFTLQVSGANRNMQKPTIKYRYDRTLY